MNVTIWYCASVVFRVSRASVEVAQFRQGREWVSTEAVVPSQEGRDPIISTHGPEFYLRENADRSARGRGEADVLSI